MATFSFIMWSVLSTLLLGFWFWTIYIVLKQRQAWRTYAEKRKMRFHSNGLLETPSMSGVVDGYNVSIFPSEHSELDARVQQRKLSAIEISLHSVLPVRCAMASGGMVHLVEMMELYQEYRPEVKGWDNSYIVRSSDVGVVEAFLTEDRLSKLVNLMKIERAWIIFLASEDVSILRLDTPLPVADAKKLDMLIKQLINAVKAFEVDSKEKKDLLRKRSDKDKEASVLRVDETILDDDIGFELEDDSE